MENLAALHLLQSCAIIFLIRQIFDNLIILNKFYPKCIFKIIVNGMTTFKK